MAYKSVTGTRTVDVELDGSVYTINFGYSYNYYAVRNDSAGTIYVSTTDKSCTPNNDGVVSIPSGGGYVHNNGFGGSAEIYILGSGSALVIAQEDSVCPFVNASGKSSSGTTGSIDYNDLENKPDLSVYVKKEDCQFMTEAELSEIIANAKGE